MTVRFERPKETTVKMPEPDDLLYLGQIYGGDHETAPWGQIYWKFVVVQYKKSVYVLENHLEDKVLLPTVKKLSIS